MALERFRFKITGTTPILMNSPLGMKKPGESVGKVKKVLPPEEEAASLLYRNQDGTVYGPAGFKSAITAAAKGMKGPGKIGLPSVIKSSVFVPIDADKIPLFDPKTKKPLTDKDYTVDSRRAVIPSSGAGIVKSRPRFERWGCIVELDIDTDYIELPLITTLLKKAGQTVGYMDFRPECGGSFGRFDAELVK